MIKILEMIMIAITTNAAAAAVAKIATFYSFIANNSKNVGTLATFSFRYQYKKQVSSSIMFF